MCSIIGHTHETFYRHQTVSETPPTTCSDYYNTTCICKLTCTFLAYCSIRPTKKSFCSHNHNNNTPHHTNVLAAFVSLYYSK